MDLIDKLIRINKVTDISWTDIANYIGVGPSTMYYWIKQRARGEQVVIKKSIEEKIVFLYHKFEEKFSHALPRGEK